MARGLMSRFWDRLFGAVDRREWLDRASDPIQGAITKTLWAGGWTGQKTADFLHGTWFGRPLAEGRIVEDSIKCPWHGAHGRRRTGRAPNLRAWVAGSRGAWNAATAACHCS